MDFFLDYPVFPQEKLDTLYGYIFLNDVSHPETVLDEDIIKADYTEAEIIASYKLCWQLLKRGVDLKAFRRLIGKIALTGGITDEEKLFFKHARARYKHMRFACNNFDKRHRQPKLFHLTIRTMGKMQDSFKNGQRFNSFKYGVFLWLLLSPVIYPFIEREITDFRAETPEGIKSYHKNELTKLKAIIENREDMTAHGFHLLRKIFSRRVAFNDTLRIVRPSEKLDHFSAFLATLNGLMGRRHDDYVEKKFTDKTGYYKNKIDLSEDILKRVELFLEKAQ